MALELNANAQLEQLKQRYGWVLEMLHDPHKLRVVCVAFAMLLGTVVVYNPMSTRITELRTQVRSEKARLRLVEDIEVLRNTQARLLKSVPETAHPNFWTEYVLGGLRETGVQLRHFETKVNSKQKIGSYTAMELDLEVGGDYTQIYKLLQWIESSTWYMRIMDLRFRKDRSAIFATVKVGVLASEGSGNGR